MTYTDITSDGGMNPTPHTTGRVTFREDGDANHWSMLTADGRWLLAILHNGEAPSERQVANFRRLVACWNACEGLDTDLLENATMLGDTIASRFALRDITERELTAQRDGLLAVLREIIDWHGHEISDPEAVESARNAIAKATGGER